MIVDKKIELEAKYLKDFPDWQFLPKEDLNRKQLKFILILKMQENIAIKIKK